MWDNGSRKLICHLNHTNLNLSIKSSQKEAGSKLLNVQMDIVTKILSYCCDDGSAVSSLIVERCYVYE